MESFWTFVDYVKFYHNFSLAMTICLGYLVHYWLFAVRRPRVCGNNKFKLFLLEHVPILHEKFWPTFWCIEARAQTILRALIKSAPDAQYNKEFVETVDGGHVAIDWQENPTSPHDAETRPTVLILPGLTGSSQESYALHFVQQATRLGYRSVVFNYRGNGGAELKTPRSYSGANTDDLELIISHIKKRYPKAPLMAAGISLGGMMLMNYLGHSGPRSGLLGAFVVGAAYDLIQAIDSVERGVNNVLFSQALARELKDNLRRYKHLFEDTCDLEHVFKSRTIRDFDDRFTAKQFGYPSWREYYEDASPHDKIHKIRVPLLCLNAADDPFSPEYALPVKECVDSSHVCMLVTRHGGHIGFLEGLLPRHESFMDRVFAQYVDAVFRHGATLRGSLGEEALT